MAVFSDVIDAQAQGHTVGAVTLAYFDFRSSPLGAWSGHGKIRIQGQDYLGLKGLGRIGAISSGPGGAVEEITLELLATAEMVALSRADNAEAAGRECLLRAQFIDVRETDAAGNWVKWQNLDAPVEIFWGRMSPLKVERSLARVGETARRIISTRAQSALLNRSRPVFSYFSHRDQLARTGGTDNLLIKTSELAAKKVRWPYFN